MATGMKETWKVWESLRLEMEAGKKEKMCGEKKREKKLPQAATGAVSTTGRGRMVGKVSGKKISKKKKKKPQRTAAEAMEDSSSSSREGSESGSSEQQKRGGESSCRSEEENRVAEARSGIELQKSSEEW
jgi:hypothetical protein